MNKLDHTFGGSYYYADPALINPMIKQHLRDSYPVEKFKKPFRDHYDCLINRLAFELQGSFPAENAEAKKEGFGQFLEDAAPSLEKTEVPTLADISADFISSSDWKHFFWETEPIKFGSRALKI